MIGQYRKLLRCHHADLEFTDGAIRVIAKMALERGTVARELSAVVEAVLEPILFETEALGYHPDHGAAGAGRRARMLTLRTARSRPVDDPARQAGEGVKVERIAATRAGSISRRLGVEPNLGTGSGVFPRPSGRRVVHVGAWIMGTSYGQFVKYPRTPHLFGSSGTDDDKHLDDAESARFLADPSLIVEEKLDGTNVGIHFSPGGVLALQCRGHLITEAMHPQYDLLKQWAAVKRPALEAILEDRLILFGEWVHARHSVLYRRLPHYFFEFDLYDKRAGAFLDLERRLEILDGSGLQTVPVVHRGTLDRGGLSALIGPSRFDAEFENPLTGRTDALMEGLYLRTEAGGVVTGRAKFVRPEFVEKIKQSEHWQRRAIVPNRLGDEADIWS